MPANHTSDLRISLVIVTYQRDAIIMDALRALFPHAEHFHEVLIVDNGNSSDLREFVTSLGIPIFKLLPQERNDGAVGRSHGILAATGDIVLTLDDDIRLADPEQLQLLKDFFRITPRVGCVNFKILYEETLALDLSDWCHPRDPLRYSDSLFETTYISEGACALNAKLAKQLGAYPLDLFIGQEGVELAARILDAGYGIYYLPSVTVTHSVAAAGRTSGRQFYFNARNIFWIATRAYPLTLAIRTVAREWSTLLVFSILRGRLSFFLRGCRDGVRQFAGLYRQRKPISSHTARHIALLNKFKPTILSRISRLAVSKTLE